MRELSVSTLLRYLKNKLDTDEKLQKISVSGEISNFHRHFSGHLYFTLKDEYAANRLPHLSGLNRKTETRSWSTQIPPSLKAADSCSCMY